MLTTNVTCLNTIKHIATKTTHITENKMYEIINCLTCDKSDNFIIIKKKSVYYIRCVHCGDIRTIEDLKLDWDIEE